MKPAPFAYARVGSANEAAHVLRALGPDAKILAGGQSLVPAMNFRLAQPSYLVDINGAAELDFLAVEGTTLRIGATARHSRVERAPELTGRWDALREAAGHVGHYPIRVRGTFGGSLAHADPTAEFPLVALTLDGEIDALSVDGGLRTIPAAAFFQGVFSTALRSDEVLVEARIPAPPQRAVTVFEEFTQRAGDFALGCVCVGVRVTDGVCDWARVGLGAVAPAPIRSAPAEAALTGSDLSSGVIEDAAQTAVRELEPPSDFHADAAYRRQLTAVLVRRALHRAASTAS